MSDIMTQAKYLKNCAQRFIDLDSDYHHESANGDELTQRNAGDARRDAFNDLWMAAQTFDRMAEEQRHEF